MRTRESCIEAQKPPFLNDGEIVRVGRFFRNLKRKGEAKKRYAVEELVTERTFPPSDRLSQQLAALQSAVRTLHRYAEYIGDGDYSVTSDTLDECMRLADPKSEGNDG